MLDAELLAENHCLFGGGTAIALRCGEYRESVDIDFLVSDIDGYRQLRQLLTGEQGLSALARKGAKIQQTGELRADQYGIRSMVRVGDVEQAPPIERNPVDSQGIAATAIVPTSSATM